MPPPRRTLFITAAFMLVVIVLTGMLMFDSDGTLLDTPLDLDPEISLAMMKHMDDHLRLGVDGKVGDGDGIVDVPGVGREPEEVKIGIERVVEEQVQKGGKKGVMMGLGMSITTTHSTKSKSITTIQRTPSTISPESSPPTATPSLSTLYPPPGVPLPPIHPLHLPPYPIPPTPLFIAFTRNYLILQQTVLSYLSSGWPASQIHIIENTGTMDSNSLGLLSAQNPFYLPHSHLKEILGVNIITTPTLLSFSQLQNFFVSYAMERGWKRFFWSHMDSVVLAHEERRPYVSFYKRILEVLSGIDNPAVDGASPSAEGGGEEGGTKKKEWALKFFSYDRLTLVNVPVVKKVGGWDTLIPYYYSDCDFYSRVRMEGFGIEEDTENVNVGSIFDVADVLSDLSLFFPNHPEFPDVDLMAGKDDVGTKTDVDVTGTRFEKLKTELMRLETQKNSNPSGRNYWQGRQKGGRRDEPFWRDPQAFEVEIARLWSWGEQVYTRKWGFETVGGAAGKCDLLAEGKGAEDMWRRD